MEQRRPLEDEKVLSLSIAVLNFQELLNEVQSLKQKFQELEGQIESLSELLKEVEGIKVNGFIDKKMDVLLAIESDIKTRILNLSDMDRWSCSKYLPVVEAQPDMESVTQALCSHPVGSSLSEVGSFFPLIRNCNCYIFFEGIMKENERRGLTSLPHNYNV